MSKLSRSLVAGLFAVLIPCAHGQERVTGDSVRQFCRTFQDEAEPRLFAADVKPPALSYQEGALWADLSRPFLIEESQRGLVEVFSGQPTEAGATMAVQEGGRLVKAQATGKLTARLVFSPQRGSLTPTPCLVLSGGRVVRVRATALWLSLLIDGREQARLLTEDGERLVPRGQPDVQIDAKGLVYDGDPQDLDGLRPAVQQVQKPALQCYQRALSQEGQDLAGTVIVGVTVDKDGRVGDARVEVDSVGEAGLGRCLREVAGGLRPPKPRRPGHLSIPFQLRLQ